MPTFAAVDIGSNSVRLKIARLTRGRLRAIHEDRESLGQIAVSHGRTAFPFASSRTLRRVAIGEQDIDAALHFQFGGITAEDAVELKVGGH